MVEIGIDTKIQYISGEQTHIAAIAIQNLVIMLDLKDAMIDNTLRQVDLTVNK